MTDQQPPPAHHPGQTALFDTGERPEMQPSTQLPVPIPAQAIEAMGKALDRWVGHTWTTHTFPVYGAVHICQTWMVAQEYVPTLTPEIGLMWQWIIRPGAPAQCFYAMAYRAAITPIQAAIGDEDQTYRDTIELTPQTAWALASSDEPATWYQQMQGTPWTT